MENVYALTTLDNPYDPFDQFNQWFMFDTEKGYNSCSYLARIAKTSDEMSEQEYNREVERAIDEIITINPLGIYRKVTKSQAI